MAELRFLGAAGTVTGSQFLVSTARCRVLIDCGMFQGSPEEIAYNRVPFEFDVARLDAVLVTHAHLDHCGRLPALVRAGYAGPIYATAGTVELAAIVLRDSAKLQEEAAERYARRHPVAAADDELQLAEGADLSAQLRRAPAVGSTRTREPLYTMQDAERTIGLFREVAYDAGVEVAPGATARFRDAGHILGSAIIELELAEPGEGGGGETRRMVVFSGDLGRPDTPILRDPTPIAHADYVVVESTYGNREHEPRSVAVGELVDAIGGVAGAKGVLIIPAFAIGRTQELVWELDRLLAEGRIPRMPLFVDSPMAARASDVYLRHPEAYDAETLKLLRSGQSPIDYPGEEYTRTADQSRAIRKAARPFMIVASSGMLTGGRIMHHLKDFLPDPAAELLFVGYQGEGTLGRHLQSGARSVRIDGEQYEVRCRIRTISGFSAHADEHELIDWLRHLTRGGAAGRPRRAFVVHGDPDAAEALRGRIESELGLPAHVPQYGETVSLA